MAFHLRQGFRVTGSDATTPIYGTLATPDYDGEGEDRVVFVRDL